MSILLAHCCKDSSLTYKIPARYVVRPRCRLHVSDVEGSIHLDHSHRDCLRDKAEVQQPPGMR